MILFTYKTPVYHYTMTPRESIVYIQLACVLTSGKRSCTKLGCTLLANTQTNKTDFEKEWLK